MLVVDASVLFEVVADTPHSELLRRRLADDTDQVAPHLIDAEVLAVIQAKHRRGVIDLTAASQAVDDLASWPGERWSHRPLLDRVWQRVTTSVRTTRSTSRSPKRSMPRCSLIVGSQRSPVCDAMWRSPDTDSTVRRLRRRTRRAPGRLADGWRCRPRPPDARVQLQGRAARPSPTSPCRPRTGR